MKRKKKRRPKRQQKPRHSFGKLKIPKRARVTGFHEWEPDFEIDLRDRDVE